VQTAWRSRGKLAHDVKADAIVPAMVVETTAINKNRDYLADWWFGTFYCIYWEFHHPN
jgi:hypothetical protein